MGGRSVEADLNRETRAAVEAAAESYQTPAHLIISASRQKDHVRPRWIVVRLLRERGLSTPNIARELGGMDHSSIVHALQRSKNMDEAWNRALERAKIAFVRHLGFLDGEIVYAAPIGPPNNPRLMLDCERKWMTALGGETFANVPVRKFTGHYIAAMSRDAQSIAREV